MTFLWMMYSLIYCLVMFVLRFVVDCFILSWVVNYLIPSFLIYYPYLFIFSRFIHLPLLFGLCRMLGQRLSIILRKGIMRMGH